MIRPRSTLLAALLFTAAGAFAAEDINWYHKYKQTRGPGIYVMGMAVGIAAASERSKQLGREPIVCLPKDLRLNEATTAELLEQEIKMPSRGFTYDGNTLLEIPITVAMTTKFACR